MSSAAPKTMPARLLRFLPILLLAGTAGALLGYLLTDDTGETEYTSRSLIVANQWEQRIEGLGRLVEAIMDTNEFRTQVRSLDPDVFGAEIDPVLSTIAVQDTVALWIEATGATPDTAERRANAGASALVGELNRLGEGVGTFSIQDAAIAPSEPRSTGLDQPIGAGVGGAAGLLVGAGLVLVLPDRRPSARRFD